MTARVTTLKGPDAGAYYVDGPGRYYLDGDEPPGRWLGRGATSLGLVGEVDDDDFLSLMDGRHPATGELLGTSHHERTVRGFDVTCSAPKSVSVLFAIGDDRVRKEVLEAHDAAVAAAFGWIEDHAHCRYRVDGEVWTVDARGLVAAAFRQHTSRAHDPQLHTHLVIPNRVMAPDGRWLALDARTLKHDQRTISALYAAGLRAELTSRLGVRWNDVVNGQAETADAPDEVLDTFSQRTRQMARRLDEKTERFVDNLGRRPTPRERWRIEREAAIDSRPTKTSEDAQTLHEHWAEQLDALGYDPSSYLERVTGRTHPIEPDATVERDAVVDALSSLRDTQSVWRPAEITREIAAALPTRLGGTATETVARARAHVGDMVATRRNDRTLLTDRGRMVKNRDHWTIQAVHADRSVTVAGTTGRVTLPVDYVALDVELAYAETSHATQGRTVDRSFLYLDAPTDTRGIYVPLTRGRTANEAFIVLSDERTAAEVIAECVARTWIDQPATALRLDHAPEPSDTGLGGRRRVAAAPAARPRLPLPADKLRELIQRAIRQQATADKHQAALDDHKMRISNLVRWAREADREHRSAEQRLADARRTLAEHDRPLRRRQHRAEIRQAKHDVADLPGKLGDLSQELTDLDARYDREKMAQRRTIAAAKARPEDFAIDKSNAAVTSDARTRGDQIAADPEQRYLDHLGRVPEDLEARERWAETAGRVAQHHALWGEPVGETFVGHMPTFDNDEDYRFTFYAANQAIHDLDQTVGVPRRALEREAPGLSL